MLSHEEAETLSVQSNRAKELWERRETKRWGILRGPFMVAIRVKTPELQWGLWPSCIWKIRPPSPPSSAPLEEGWSPCPGIWPHSTQDVRSLEAGYVLLTKQPIWTWKVKVVQSCPTLCYPMDNTVHGILQARLLEWVAFPLSRGSSQPKDQIQVSRIAGGFFTSWATREALSEHMNIYFCQHKARLLEHPDFRNASFPAKYRKNPEAGLSECSSGTWKHKHAVWN